METKPINVTFKVIFSRAIFESFGFVFGLMIGMTAGFMLGYIYVIFPFGVP